MELLEELLLALEQSVRLGDNLSGCVGFLIATIENDETLTEQGVESGRQGILCWHRARQLITELTTQIREDME